MTLLQRIEKIRLEATASLRAAESALDLQEVRAQYLGRQAELPLLLRDLPALSKDERAQVGRLGNEVRRDLDALISARHEQLADRELAARLVADKVDLTLPGTPPQAVGRLHAVTAIRRELEDIFVGLGFTVVEGPEVEFVSYNFDALNHPPTHPARRHTDTYYVSEDIVLRTHTSPMQVRIMQQQPPPLYVVVPGRVYRRDSDVTHTEQFHQIEGLAVAEDITLADLKGTLFAFARQVFGPERGIRLRGHYFPFTEPSVELDVSCSNCRDGFQRDGSRCGVCKGEAWIEVLGAGEVDPAVFEAVGDPAYDPERVQGFAWGIGVERIAMMKYGFSDIRSLLENDVRFLEQIG